ncbi:MAG: glutamyl-tRNA amidotransferase [Woeseiaceae bacterium]|jgi:uncharacterized protein YqeY|nr:glutamyl-tRNA amidotransferase [Woeseiaceae bacterium]MDG1016723.1 GatB/YqeY domain-containing protein [Woeseiaceae bacterium]|tara:strand:+ start:247 stop:693 length:447 start_codon:yes stop_codon:yes gene_type:complete
MSLKNRIQEEMKDAMRSGERDRLKVIRLILSSIKQIEVDTRSEVSDDDEVLLIINKMVKQRRDSIKQFVAGNRHDLADIESAEIIILEQYLPAQLTTEEIEVIIKNTIAECAATSMKDMGKVMAGIKSKINGRADMSIISQKIKTYLS